MKSKKKIIAIFIISIIMLTILFTICSNIYKVYAGSLSTETIMGFDNINSGGVAGGPAGTLQVNGNRVYCMNEGANFSSNLGSSLAAVQAQAAGKSGTAETLADAEAAAQAASDGQKFDVKLAMLENVPSSKVASAEHDAAVFALARDLGLSSEDTQYALWDKIILGDYADKVVEWEDKSAFEKAESTNIEAPATISYDGSGSSFTANDVVVNFPTMDYGEKSFITSEVSISTGSISEGAGASGSAFEISIPYEGNETTKEVTISATISYPSGTYVITPAEYYQIKTKRYWVDKGGTWTTGYVAAVTDEETGEVITEAYYTWSVAAAHINSDKDWSKDGNQQIVVPPVTGINYAEYTVSTTIQLETPKPPSIDPPGGDTPEDNEYGMQIGGFVWDDSVVEGKNQEVNGAIDNGEEYLSGILVSLYEVDSSGKLTLAELISNGGNRTFADKENVSKGYIPSTNPTITDKNGYYVFKNVYLNRKYVVVFTYNGVDYISTATNETTEATLADYNTDRWIQSSKGSELISERNNLNSKFMTVGSTPNNYKVTNPIFDDRSYLSYDNGYYNRVFKEKELEDIKLEIYKEEINAIMAKRSLSMEDGSYIKNVCRNVASKNNNTNEVKQMLQYIYDSKIKSYSGYNSEEGGTATLKQEYYPVYDNILLSYQYLGDGGNKKNDTGSFDYNLGQMWKDYADIEYPYENGKGYGYIYIGQYYINQGLVKRNTTNLSLSQDLYKTVVSINGKDEEYKYGTLSDKKMTVDEADYISQNEISYEQKISADEYNYKADSTNLNGTANYYNNQDSNDKMPKIELYATYKISIKNLSNVPTSINEVVTYFDKKYLSYSDGYTTSQGRNIEGMTAVYSFEQTRDITKEITVNENSKFGTSSETKDNLELSGDYTDLYLTFANDGILLETNASITVYVTYRLGENSTSHNKYNCTYGEDNSAQKILQDELGTKDDGGNSLNIETIAEINGFSTFYKKTSDTATIQNKYKAYYQYFEGLYRPAGMLDEYSLPGNLDSEQIKFANDNGRAKEHDWDTAPTLILSNPGGTRSLAGNVWETDDFANYYYDNLAPMLDENSNTIEGLTVQLVELKDDKQYVRAVTQTKEDGSYKFEGFTPGDYVVRFVYGDKSIEGSKEGILNGQTYNYPYNGEFYQSAKSNPSTNAIINSIERNTRFWYANDESTRYSDAYDESNRRNEVNSIFSSDVVDGYVYSDAVDTIINPQKYMMYAYTAMMEIYPEKAKTTIIENGSKPVYEIKNIDFALTPRTTTKLNITKEVSNIKLTLQNGSVQFDTTPETIRQQGVPGVVQVNKGSTINISMSNELLNGATIEITYKIIAKNNSDYNSTTYYRDSSNNIVAIALYEEPYTDLLTYESNYTEYDNTEKMIITKERNLTRTYSKENVNVNDINAGKTELKECKTKEIKVTTTSPSVVADFISNNLNFTETDSVGKVINSGWEIYKGNSEDIYQEFIDKYYSSKETTTDTTSKFGDINSTEVYNVNTIVVANKDNPLITTKLSPKSKDGTKEGGESTSYITLSQVISTENDLTDTKKYNNNVRIVKVDNTVSRIQDLNSTSDGEKLSYKSEDVTITDPTGENRGYMYITLTIVVITIIAIGVILIKKYVLK